ncbi:hypothetical protein KHS38_16525 [Mucilaginibacter sp. Bleaf8]|uniref:hypothetical protein n=1 Tax=Mucilaginibacter sp. Bleaf8 TaxID=2834430 RepID=UPI001BD117A1|nr:hypothetical protein [Mucilaginibacter sp. Bleaf8]MBS7566014.1 hypothetical protein [Mucilaginibacter sp. Bleaf8]
MLFEEFFKKKKIDLAALQQGEPDLFSEFKEHFEQMGEKSFDHTKKYWFNKLRRLYPLPPEVKAEKPRMENQVAEQTVSDTLTEPKPRDVAPKLGFKPKFKTGATTTTPAEEPVAANTPATETPVEQQDATPQAATPAPKMGFKPKFKAGVTKPAEEQQSTQPAPEASAEPAANTLAEQPAAETPAAKPAYKPRFQAKSMQPKPATEPVAPSTDTGQGEKPSEIPATKTEPQAEAETEANNSTEIPAPVAPKMGFKPRFKASAPPKVIEGEQSSPEETVSPAPVQQPAEITSTDVAPQAEETDAASAVQESAPEETANNSPAPQSPTAAEPVAKPAYKPRFNPKMIKPKPPEQE